MVYRLVCLFVFFFSKQKPEYEMRMSDGSSDVCSSDLPMFMLWSSMTRVSPTGVVSGPGERNDAYAALQALTTGPAWQAFEEDRKGRIKSGLLPVFVILTRNPLTRPADGFRNLRVPERTREGPRVWKRANWGGTAFPAPRTRIALSAAPSTRRPPPIPPAGAGPEG